ncbi:MAG: 3'-5' exonuclease, partial [Rhodothermales bacterium]
DGLTYLRDVFAQLLVEMEIDLNARFELETQYHALFERAEKRIADSGGEIPTDIDSYRRFFRHPSGVVVSTCHAVKGEEYETVIAFALLRGYVPNWEVLINGTREDASERESKLLYVISSRAKRRLHLIAESGRRTRNGNPYETSRLLQRVEFDYDPIGPGVN